MREISHAIDVSVDEWMAMLPRELKLAVEKVRHQNEIRSTSSRLDDEEEFPFQNGSVCTTMASPLWWKTLKPVRTVR
jgi:hypothetical protein